MTNTLKEKGILTHSCCNRKPVYNEQDVMESIQQLKEKIIDAVPKASGQSNSVDNNISGQRCMMQKSLEAIDEVMGRWDK